MNDQRRVLLAFLMMALVLGATQWWYSRLEPAAEDSEAPTSEVVEPAGQPDAGATAARPPATVPEREVPPPPPADTGAGSGAAADTLGAGEGPDAEAEAPPSAPGSWPANELLAGAAPGPVRVETPLAIVTIDPRGGIVRQVELLRYPSYTGPGPVRLVPGDGAFLRRVVDLDERRIELDAIAFAPSDTLLRVDAGDTERTLELAYEGGGRRVVQRFRFAADDYVIDYELDLGEPVDGVLRTAFEPRLASNEKNPGEDYGQLRAVARVDGAIVSRSAKDVDEGEALALGGEVDWAGMKNKYFLAMLLAPTDRTLSATRFAATEGDSLPRLLVEVGAPVVGGRARDRAFFGPQEYRRLAGLNDGLDDVNQYGWSWIRWMVSPFAKLIVVVMLWLHRFIPSYGLVLIVFGLLVRVLMWPLTTKSYASIQAMQRLQPELQRIRERYKSDPQKMQQETMRLYREKKVNPLGGCLPNLIPMPILFALFFVFQSTIEFRGQPFLWLPDLSQPDPIYVLPVLMGLTMFASSKLTTTDPKMSAMVYVMPIVLTFVFLNLAAGLVLYYAFSNLLTFVQQWWLRGRAAPAEAPSG